MAKFGDLEQGDMFCTAEARWVKLADPKYSDRGLAMVVMTSPLPNSPALKEERRFESDTEVEVLYPCQGH